MKAAIYVRVENPSTLIEHAQSEKTDRLKRFATMNNLAIRSVYVNDTSSDDGEDEIQRLLEDLYYGEAKVLLAERVDELIASSALVDAILELNKSGVLQVVTLDTKVNSYIQHRSYWAKALGVSLTPTSSKIQSKNIKNTHRKKAEMGIYKGSTPPYGYKNVQGVLIVKKDGTPRTVQYIFDKYLSGSTMDEIANMLTSLSVETPGAVAGKSNAAQKWRRSSIQTILENPHYTGDLVFNRETKEREKTPDSEKIVVRDTHEAIISKEQFNKVQELLKSKKKRK